MEKIIEVNLGIGMNMLFPEPVKIVIETDKDEKTNQDEKEDN